MTRLLPPFVATAHGRLASSALPLRFITFLVTFLGCFSSLDFRASSRRRAPVLGCSGAKLPCGAAIMWRLHHAASFAIRRAVRFRCREAATPGPRSTPRRRPPLVRRIFGEAQSRANEQSRYVPWRSFAVAIMCRTDEHPVPDEANLPPEHPA